MANIFQYEAADEAATVRLGRALAAALPDGAVVSLVGTLGAGKTRLVQAAAAASGAPPDAATSPTFVLVHEYPGRRPIVHFDAYRLRTAEEFLDLGPSEYFAAGGIAFVEWGDRVRQFLPVDALEIQIEVTGELARRFTITAPGERGAESIAAIQRALNASENY